LTTLVSALPGWEQAHLLQHGRVVPGDPGLEDLAVFETVVSGELGIYVVARWGQPCHLAGGGVPIRANDGDQITLGDQLEDFDLCVAERPHRLPHHRLEVVQGFDPDVGRRLAVPVVGLRNVAVDIVVPFEVQGQLLAFLEAQGYASDHVSAGYSNHSHPDHDLGRLDVVYVRGSTAQKIFNDVSMHDGPGGISIPVPRPEHLAAMKIFAIKNNPSRVLQDLEDIQRLMRLSGVDRDEIIEYMKKHNLEGLLDRLE